MKKKSESASLDFSLKGIAKRTSLFGFFGLFPTMLILIQSEELGASLFSVYLSLVLTGLLIVTPILYYFLTKNKPPKVSKFGPLLILSFISIIFCFCSAQLFFYFFFAAMPMTLRASGLTLVIVTGAIWATLCWRDHIQATEKSGLLSSAAYAEYADHYIYDQFKAGDLLSRHLHLRNPFSWPYLIGFLIIAPFGTFFYRFFGDYIGHHGMMWVLGFLAFPLYLFFIGAIVQVYRQTISIPKMLTQQTGKAVYWMD